MSQKNLALIFSQINRVSGSNGLKAAGSSMSTIFILSCLVNVLFLTGPIFMMQVYDRVLGSGNIPTLIGLYAIALLLYIMMGLFDTLRQQIGTLRGEEVAAVYDGPAFQATLEANAAGVIDERTNAPEDVDTLRNFISSPGMITFFDLPAIPFYFLAIMLLHPVLGMVAVVAGLILTVLAAFNNRHSRTNMAQAQGKMAGVNRILGAARQDAESIRANGMAHAAQDYWQGKQATGRAELVSSMRVSSAVTSVTKTLRMAIQSLVLGVGGWLAVVGVLSPGAMIAASIVFSRSIAPLEQLLGNFRNLARAKGAWDNIQKWSPDYLKDDEEPFNLPAPKNNVVALNMSVRIPKQDKSLLTGVSTELVAGDVLVIIGPSGVGKTSLLKTLVGTWEIPSGTLRLDGAELAQWPQEKLGDHIGYLSQYTQLLNGTVAQNISRFRPDTPSDQVIAAAKVASVHDMILGFENGYETQVGEGATQLSGGQRQRIGLARALFGAPFLAVLDEPTAHLDSPGKLALAQALLDRRRAGKITILTSHDELVLKLVNKVMVLEKGRMTMSGPKEAVIAKLQETQADALPGGMRPEMPAQSEPVAQNQPALQNHAALQNQPALQNQMQSQAQNQAQNQAQLMAGAGAHTQAPPPHAANPQNSQQAMTAQMRTAQVMAAQKAAQGAQAIASQPAPPMGNSAPPAQAQPPGAQPSGNVYLEALKARMQENPPQPNKAPPAKSAALKPLPLEPDSSVARAKQDLAGVNPYAAALPPLPKLQTQHMLQANSVNNGQPYQPVQAVNVAPNMQSRNIPVNSGSTLKEFTPQMAMRKNQSANRSGTIA